MCSLVTVLKSVLKCVGRELVWHRHVLIKKKNTEKEQIHQKSKSNSSHVLFTLFSVCNVEAKRKPKHGRGLVLCTPIWALRSQVRLTELSSHHDDDECVLAAGLFLALKTRRMLHFRTTWHTQQYHIPTSWMLNERSRWLHALSLHHYSIRPFESLSLCLFSRR